MIILNILFTPYTIRPCQWALPELPPGLLALRDQLLGLKELLLGLVNLFLTLFVFDFLVEGFGVHQRGDFALCLFIPGRNNGPGFPDWIVGLGCFLHDAHELLLLLLSECFVAFVVRSDLGREQLDQIFIGGDDCVVENDTCADDQCSYKRHFGPSVP